MAAKKGVMVSDKEAAKATPVRMPEKLDEPLSLIESGIPGLDKILGGGLPKDASILLTGVAGSGKTIFSMQYLQQGAQKDEPGVFLSLKESSKKLLQELGGFHWGLDGLIEKKKLAIVSTEIYRFESLLTMLEDTIESYNAKRLVIDSVSVLGLFFDNLFKTRRSLVELDRMVKKMGCTTLLVSQVQESPHTLSSFGVEEFVSDGIILLDYKQISQHPSQYLHTVTVRKMRGLNHSNNEHICAISKDGITVYPERIY